MFPSYRDNKNDFLHEKHRRRARNDPHNRDYICPCGKSYLSYPALFTHIKQKHNGRAPGQIIKPKPENGRGRGRPKQRENYDSESDTEDETANTIGNLCDYITDINRTPPFELKKLYTSSDFYLVYVNHKESEPKYNEEQDIYQDTIDHILCEFLVQISRRQVEPYLFDEMFIFVMFLTKALNEMNRVDDKIDFCKRERAKKLVYGFNLFVLDYLPKYINEFKLEGKQFLQTKHVMKLLELTYSWMINKKYSKDRFRKNILFAVEGQQQPKVS